MAYLEGEKDLIEFRLHSEGSNKNPNWGIAFRHAGDVPHLLDTLPATRPNSIEIEFPDGSVFDFRIRPSFWTGCHEFVDAQVIGGGRPVLSWAVLGKGYSVSTKGRCEIVGVVVKRNRRLRLVVFK